MARSAVPISEADVSISRNLRRIREGKKMSQGALAAEMNEFGFTSWTSNTVSKVEQLEDGANTRRVSAAELIALAKALDISLNDFAASNKGDTLALNRARGLGEKLAETLEVLDWHASTALTDAEAFQKAHDALLESGEYGADIASGNYATLLSNLDSELLADIEIIRKRIGRRAAPREGVPRYGKVVETEDANGNVINIQFDSPEAFAHYEETGELMDGAGLMT